MTRDKDKDKEKEQQAQQNTVEQEAGQTSEDPAAKQGSEQAAKETEGQAGAGQETAGTGEAREQAQEPSQEKAEAGDSTGEEEALQTRYLRLMADFQNFKRRTEKEKSDIYAYANEKIVSELLAVMDNFERALEHGAPDDPYAQGMEMIFKQLGGVLEKAGVAEIEALGLDFDPNFHNAVMTEDSEEYESGKVSAVLQKGYTLKGKVVRPSMVKVAN